MIRDCRFGRTIDNDRLPSGTAHSQQIENLVVVRVPRCQGHRTGTVGDPGAVPHSHTVEGCIEYTHSSNRIQLYRVR